MLEIVFDGNGPGFWHDGFEVAHEAQSLLIVIVDFHEFVATETVALDGAKAIFRGIKARVF